MESKTKVKSELGSKYKIYISSSSSNSSSFKESYTFDLCVKSLYFSWYKNFLFIMSIQWRNNSELKNERLQENL